VSTLRRVKLRLADLPGVCSDAAPPGYPVGLSLSGYNKTSIRPRVEALLGTGLEGGRAGGNSGSRTGPPGMWVGDSLVVRMVGVMVLLAYLLAGCGEREAARPAVVGPSSGVTVLPASGTPPPGWPILRAPTSAGAQTEVAVAESGGPGQPGVSPSTDAGGAMATGAPAGRGPAAATSAVQADARVEAALAALVSDEDRVGQLLLPGWIGNTAEAARRTLQELRPGGFVHVDNTRVAQEATAINTALWQMARESGVLPPLIAMDHEGGPVQRITDVPNLGSNREFAQRGGSERDACMRGQVHAQHLRQMGFSMNLAPVLDVNNNPANPVIGDRAYGADPDLVARLGSAYVWGLQAGGVAAVGKHFPGHGNTAVDSHVQLPTLPHSVRELEQVELLPFRRSMAADTEIAAIMSAHIVFPAVDPSGAPATLSRPVMTGLLRDTLGFRGLVLSDDLAGMRAITDHFAPGEAAVRAVQAGVDMLIVGGGLPRQVESRDALLAALRSGALGRERVEDAVRHVLQVKARFGLLGGPVAPSADCA
jgi:beta-N-acetylhexosaminidase